MRKLMIAAAMVSMAIAANAQDDLVKQAKKLCDKGELEQALQTIEPALTSDETTDKANAWNVMSNIQYGIFMREMKVPEENAAKGTDNVQDTAKMHGAMVAALEAAMQCDKYDCQPNEKGKVKLRFRQTNGPKFQLSRPYVISAGQYEYGKGNVEQAVKAWKLYIDCANDSLFAGLDMSNDPYRPDVCYFIGLASYNLKDYPTAIKYANMAAEDSSRVKDAKEIVLFAQRDGAKTKEDSLAYLETVKQFHAMMPDEPRYFNMLMDYYSKPGRQEEMKAWVEAEIARDPNNKMAWALKGEAEMNASQWDDAVASYAKAAELDPSFVQVIFNAGVCLNQKAIEMKDKLADKNTGGLTAENADKVKEVLAEAQVYLERAREIDPDRKSVNWAYPLYQIYYNLGDTEKSSEMEKLLGGE